MGSRRDATGRLSERRRAVFLDRDGVLNDAAVKDGRPHPPAGVADLRFVEGARDAVAALREAGFITICVTNQPDVARKTLPQNTADAMNRAVCERLGLDDLIACYHDDSDACACRKPRPGMLVEGARRHALDLFESYMVGDRWRDVDAGAAAGCRTILVDRSWPERGPARVPDATVGSLDEAVTWILADSRGKHGRT